MDESIEQFDSILAPKFSASTLGTSNKLLNVGVFFLQGSYSIISTEVLSIGQVRRYDVNVESTPLVGHNHLVEQMIRKVGANWRPCSFRPPVCKSKLRYFCKKSPCALVLFKTIMRTCLRVNPNVSNPRPLCFKG